MRLCFAGVYQLVSQNFVKRDIQQTVGVQMADFVVVQTILRAAEPINSLRQLGPGNNSVLHGVLCEESFSMKNHDVGEKRGHRTAAGDHE